jgi:hypothetical protein
VRAGEREFIISPVYGNLNLSEWKKYNSSFNTL